MMNKYHGEVIQQTYLMLQLEQELGLGSLNQFQHFRYIVLASFIDGGNWSNWREKMANCNIVKNNCCLFIEDLPNIIPGKFYSILS